MDSCQAQRKVNSSNTISFSIYLLVKWRLQPLEKGGIIILLKWDGHTHTPYCYHGSDILQELYIVQAIKLGFQRYTLSEHSPLPIDWIDDIRLYKRLAMPRDELSLYIQHAKRFKLNYQDKIDVTVGLELDYLPGKLDYTESILNDWGQELEDVIFSVHYLPGVGGIRLIDYRPDYFKDYILAYYGTMEKVVDEYYDHIEAAITWVSQLSNRKRIGHINLIEKFKDALPKMDEMQIKERLERIVPLLIKNNVGLDVNTARIKSRDMWQAIRIGMVSY
ncbi:MAG: histidinol-phosphatase HisJ [Bacillota bacterium]